MKNARVLATLLLLAVTLVPLHGAEALSIAVIDLHGDVSLPVQENWELYSGLDRRGGPLEVVGTCPADVTQIQIDAVLPRTRNGETATDTYVLKAFKTGSTTFRYRLSAALGNLGEGTTLYTVTATRGAKGVLKRSFSVDYRRYDTDWRDGGPSLLPAKFGLALSFLVMNPDGSLGPPEPYAGLNDGSTYRVLDHAYLRLDGSRLEAPPGAPSWVRTYPFYGGVAWVMTGDRESGIWTAIDANGQTLFTSSLARAFDFVGGFALVQDASGKWGVISASGKLVVAPAYNQNELPPTLKPGLVLVSPGRRNEPFVKLLLPSGKEWGLPSAALADSFLDAQGRIIRLAETQAYGATGAATTTLAFSEESGKALGKVTLPGLIDNKLWLRESGVLLVDLAKDGAAAAVEKVALSTRGQRLAVPPLGFSALGSRDPRWLVSYGGFRFLYDAKAGDLAVPFDRSTEWLDAGFSQTRDPESKRWRVTDVARKLSWDLPSGQKALGRSEAVLFLASEDDTFAAQPKGFYAELRDTGVRVRSEPTTKGKVLTTLVRPTGEEPLMLEIDNLSPHLQTIDGVQGFWAHIREGSLSAAPAGGWLFSSFLAPQNTGDW